MLELKEYKTPDGWNTSDTGITTEEWLQLLEDDSIIKEENLKWIFRFYREPDHQSSCIQLSKKYKVNAQTINAYMTNCARAIQKHLNRFTIASDEAEGLHYITILVKGKYAGKSTEGYLFKIREELAAALEQMLYKRLLERFKEEVIPIGLDKKGIDEEYKWQIITDCVGKGDVDILKRLLGTNLIDNQYDGAAVRKLLQSEPEEISKCFSVLRGGRDGLQERYNQFKQKADAITNGRWKYSIGDERMAGAFLACANPELYTFYKYDVYTALCSYFGIQPQPSRRILPHFYEIIDNLLAQIEKDSELMAFFENETTEYVQSPLLTAQTIAWYMKDYMNTESSAKTEFTWIPFMHELAEKLYEYKDNRKELLKIFYGLDRNLTGAYQEEGEDIEDITPFTILGTLAIGNAPRRSQFASYYKKAFSMESSIPSDYVGFPSMNPQKAMFIYGKNKKAYTQCFWDLLGNALNGEDISDAFNEAIKVKGTYKNLSMGLFWVSPYSFFSMDGTNEAYLINKYGFDKFPPKKNLTAEYYLALMEQLKNKMESGEIEEKNFLEISANAYAYGKDDNNDEDMIEDPNPYYQEITDALKDKKNIIIQGAPGTGKTYAIPEVVVRLCEGEFDDLDLSDRAAIMNAYQKLCTERRVVFTTFHQSMDYEDFVEGLKPEVDEEGNVSYKVEDGIFKTICQEASKPIIRNNSIDISSDAVIWKVSLEGTGDNETRRDCMKNNYIRVGYDDAGPLLDGVIGDVSGKLVLDALINKVAIGDIVLSCYSSREIDAIGIVTGEYEWRGDSFKHYKRVRTVRWLVKGIKEDIVGINGGKTMTLSTVYRLNNISVDAVIDILKKHNAAGSTSAEKNTKPYVLVIDEINRGNISKIFGELITLLEADKRADGAMPLSVKLPYSKGKNEPDFSVPSNVYIIGTMNTADRSLTQFDYAMRRRFRFLTMAYNFVDINLAPGKAFQEELFMKVSRLFIGNLDEYMNDPNVRVEPAKCFSPEFKPMDLWIGPSYFITDDAGADTEYSNSVSEPAEPAKDLSLYNNIFYEIIPTLEHYIEDGVFIDEEPVYQVIDELKEIAFAAIEQ